MACVAVPCSLPVTTGTGFAVEIVDACETDGTGGCMEDVVGTTAEGSKANAGDGSRMGCVVGMQVGGCVDDSSVDCDREATSMLRLLHVPLCADR